MAWIAIIPFCGCKIHWNDSQTKERPERPVLLSNKIRSEIIGFIFMLLPPFQPLHLKKLTVIASHTQVTQMLSYEILQKDTNLNLSQFTSSSFVFHKLFKQMRAKLLLKFTKKMESRIIQNKSFSYKE